MNFNGSEKYVAGAGTTALGTIGTVTGGAALLSVLNNGGLGGLLGGGNAKVQEVMSENAMLKAEKYSDAQDAKLYDAVRALEQKAAATDTAVICLQKELTAYETSQKEIRDLEKKLIDCQINGVAKDLNCLAGTVDNMAKSFTGKINSINATIGGFTKTVIRSTAICDDDCDTCTNGVQ